MKKNIAIAKEARERIAKAFKVTERTVFNALSLTDGDNDLHRRIRKAALENGGRWMVSVPMDEAIFDAGGAMRFYSDNGAVAEFYRADGSGRIFFKGKEVAVYENVDIPMIYEIRERAAALR